MTRPKAGYYYVGILLTVASKISQFSAKDGLIASPGAERWRSSHSAAKDGKMTLPIPANVL
jgi:hypothetical protein